MKKFLYYFLFILACTFTLASCGQNNKEISPAQTSEPEEIWEDDGRSIYLSDIEIKSWKMYQATSDDKYPKYVPNFNINEQGGKITVAGVQYEKGIRTHPDEDGYGDLVYDISCYDFKTFRAVVGKDSGAGPQGSDIYFTVIGDGEILAESPILFYGQSYEIYADIRGVKELVLKVYMGADIGYDSCAWADAILCNKKIPKDKQSGLNISKKVPSKDERTPAEKYKEYFNNPETFPVSFYYGDTYYSGFSGDKFDKISHNTGKGRNSRTDELILKIKKTDVYVTVTGALYEDFDTYEWTVYFENKGKKDSEIISQLKGAETFFFGSDPVIYGMRGDGEAQFEKYTVKLDNYYSVFNQSGRNTHSTCPYFGLDFGDYGFNIAIGWQGCYRADFRKTNNSDGEDAVYFYDGQILLNTYLKPGEKIRTPMTVIQEYKGKREAGINAWRDWFVKCNLPENWEPVITASSSWLYDCMTNADEDSQIKAINRYVKEKAQLDYWWMDAGWYYSPESTKVSSWTQTGNYNVDTDRFPTSFKYVTDYARKNGLIGTIVWFEPEIFRTSPANLKRVYPEFREEWTFGENSGLYDMGNSEAVAFLVKNVEKVLINGNISVYRQDFNTDPAGIWRSHDESPDRSGITENKYCQGSLAFWDRLLEDIPGLLIDNCASGGGRLDVESLRRSVPLHRTDYNIENSTVTQSMSMSLFEWIPFSGGPSNTQLGTKIDPYMIRSTFNASITLNYNVNNSKLDWNLLAELMSELKTVQKYILKDYYLLSGYSKEATDWAVWEFIDKDTCEGVVQVFRRDKAADSQFIVRLKGLNKEKTYCVYDFNNKTTVKYSGKDLTENGLLISYDKKGTSGTYYFYCC